jgi:hypothetical protein
MAECVHSSLVRSGQVGALTVAGLRVAGERLDVTISSDGRIESLSGPAGLIVEEHHSGPAS